MLKRCRAIRQPLTGDASGMTLMEVIVATVVVAIVLLALVTMYITSLQSWQRSGARLALQRNAALALDRVVFDVRHGSRVEVGSSPPSMTVYRGPAGADTVTAVYQLAPADGELRYQRPSQQQIVLLDKITSLQFTSPNGISVEIELSLEDDLGTTDLEGDDREIYFRSAAVCRNRS
jgi:prepilin-type N-terminal cleavage/methylation domain-containing protein